MPSHTCPYGIKALDLLKRKGFAVADHHLTSREETDAFKVQHDVATTPQVFIDGRRIPWPACPRSRKRKLNRPSHPPLRPATPARPNMRQWGTASYRQTRRPWPRRRR